MPTTKEDLLERTRALLPGIAARAPQAEAQRRPHDDSIRELVEAGVMQTLVPQRFGGESVRRRRTVLGASSRMPRRRVRTGRHSL